MPDKLRGLKSLGELADRRMPLPPHETEVHTAHAVDALAMRDLGGERQGILGACTGFVDLAAQREGHGQVRRGSGSMFEPERIEALQRESQQLLGRLVLAQKQQTPSVVGEESRLIEPSHAFPGRILTSAI